jgi:hypothetical protein
MSDRRAVGRTQVTKDVRILVRQGSIPCTVVNLTNNGACLAVEDGSHVPERFEVAFGHQQARRRCRVTWRNADRIGIAFER